MDSCQWFDRSVGGWHRYKDNILVDTKYNDSKDAPAFDNVPVVKIQPDKVQGKTRLLKKNYLSNKELCREIALSKEQGKMTDKLSHMVIMLVMRISKKPNFSGYSYIDEMRNEAILTLCVAWTKFNPEKSDNAFAYLTTCTLNAFNQVLNKEKKVRVLRDSLLTMEGQIPSYAAQDDHAEQYHNNWHSDD